MTLTWKHLQRRTLLKLINTKTKKQKTKQKKQTESSTEDKTDMNITKINDCKKSEQHFYDGIQNRHEHY